MVPGGPTGTTRMQRDWVRHNSSTCSMRQRQARMQQAARPHAACTRFSCPVRHALCMHAMQPEHADHGTEQMARTGWDPDGVFKSAKPLAASGEDLFAARERRRKAALAGPGAAAGNASATMAAAAADSPRSAAVAPPEVMHASTSPSQPDPAAASTAAHVAPAAASTSHPPPVIISSEPAPPASRAWPFPVRALPPATLLQGGVPAAHDDPSVGYSRDAFQQQMLTRYMGIDLDTPGMRVLCLDPPVLTIDGFLASDVCEKLQELATASGCLTTSKIGGGNAAAAGSNAYDARRTSSSMLLDSRVLSTNHALRSLMARFHEKARALLAPAGDYWGKAGVLPVPSQYCFESPQVARYEQGQHFLSHEDGFFVRLARDNGFNRHATLLMYLNDVPQGGTTRFDHLGIEVTPRQGKMLVFFPSFADGRPDERTLHTATDAVATKWVMQQWVARGFSDTPHPPTTTAGAAAAKPPAPPVPQVFTIPVPQSAPAAMKPPAPKGKAGGKGGKKGKKGF